MPDKFTLLVAMALSVCAASSAGAADVGQTLSESEIREALVGHKVTGKPPKGNKWTAVYAEDGTAEYGDGSTGTWVIKNGQFCDFPTGDKEYCRKVIQLKGKKVQMIKEDGSKGSVISY